ncbi:MAG: MFS transporter [Candidatus Hydrogenedentes bacterium]|nr:MFS transporter [Candidatus Hydrogenedentota bacterium]
MSFSSGEPLESGTAAVKSKWVVLAAASLGWLFAGTQLGLMPFAALTISTDFMGAGFTKAGAGSWFAAYSAVTMLGAAIGGLVFGNLGDRFGRAKGLSWSILCYTVFGIAGYFAQTQPQLLALRFFVGLGVGGTWPNGVSLLAEFWADVSRPALAGLMGAAANLGILLLSLLGKWYVVTPETWRPFMLITGSPIVLGLLALWLVPESPKWLQSRAVSSTQRPAMPLVALFRPPLIRSTMLGICLGAIPLLGAWASSKWMLPWAEQIGGAAHPGYKASTLFCWSVGATLGGLLGGYVGQLLGRRLSYALISLCASSLNVYIFTFLEPLQPGFLPAVFVQGLVSTLFFGWLPLYLPEIFPTHVRATGTGISYNSGRFLTAGGVMAAGLLIQMFHGNYARVGAVTGLVYAVGVLVIWLAPETKGQQLKA